MTEQYLGTGINSPRSVKIEDGDYQVTLDDSIVAASTISAPSTITLPDTRVLPGWVVCVKAQSLAGGSVTIQGLNGQLIDGVATFVLLMANDSVILQSIGGSWVVCGRVQVGGAAAESLAVTMGVGNTTPGGGVDLVVSAGDAIRSAAGTDLSLQSPGGQRVRIDGSGWPLVDAVGALLSDGAGTLSWGSVAAAPLPVVLAAGNQTGPVGAINLNIIGQPTTRRSGGSLSIGDGTFNAGHIEGTGGSGLSGNFGGGEVAWIGGNAFAGGTGSGGGVTLRGGDGETSGGGGAIGIFAGDPGNIGDGAGVDIRASDGTAEPGSFGGPMEITAGSVPGGGANVPGSVSLLRGFGGNQESNINVNGPFKLWSRTVVQVGAFTVAETAFHVGSFIYVSDESGGGQPAWSDATDWRRVSDGAIVS